jgi:NADH dehydrogenase
LVEPQSKTKATRHGDPDPGAIGNTTLELLKRSDTAGRIYEFGGPQAYSFEVLVQLLLTGLDRQRILILIPFALAAMQAGLLEL